MCPKQDASSEQDASLAREDAEALPLPLLSAADVDFIHGLRATATSEIAKGKGLEGFLQAFIDHLDFFEQQIRRAETWNGTQPGPPPVIPEFGMITAENDLVHFTGTVIIGGPREDDTFQLLASSLDEATEIVNYVAGVDTAGQRLDEMRRRCSQLAHDRARVDREQKRLKQPAETTVDDHIRLLRQYNKMKDVGQQLIGLIAENRGVPVGSLYVNQDYGVGADD